MFVNVKEIQEMLQSQNEFFNECLRLLLLEDVATKLHIYGRKDGIKKLGKGVGGDRLWYVMHFYILK